jgi:hypothetical protein
MTFVVDVCVEKLYIERGYHTVIELLGVLKSNMKTIKVDIILNIRIFIIKFSYQNTHN